MTIERKDINELRTELRKAGAEYRGISGWFYFGRPIALCFDGKNWFSVLPF